MKNVQIIDGATDCCYDVYAVTDEEFELLFPNGTDVEFISDFATRVGEKKATIVINAMWARRQDKKHLHGIHGTLFYGLDFKKAHYPTKKESEMVAVLQQPQEHDQNLPWVESEDGEEWGKKSEVGTELHVIGPGLKDSSIRKELASRFGLEFKKGRVPDGSAGSCTYKTGYIKTFFVDDQLEKLKEMYADRSEELTDYIGKYDLETVVSIVIYMDRNQTPGFGMSNEFIAFLNSAGASVDVDMYIL
jgi:hypothetical protein